MSETRKDFHLLLGIKWAWLDNDRPFEYGYVFQPGMGVCAERKEDLKLILEIGEDVSQCKLLRGTNVLVQFMVVNSLVSGVPRLIWSDKP